MVSAAPPCANDPAPHHATVVVRHGNDSEKSACVGFSGSTINGKDLLAASGIEAGFSPDPNFGDAVCQVDWEPGSYGPDCLKQPSYWHISVATCGGSWTDARRGIDGLYFGDNQAEGFSFIPQGGGQTPKPPGDRCPPRAPAPTGTGASGNPTAPGGGGSGGAASPDTPPGVAGTAAGSSSSPGPDPSAGSTPDVAASANPGELALGGVAAPAPSGEPGKPLLASPSNMLGIGTAGLVGVGLIALLVVQLIIPRLRR